MKKMHCFYLLGSDRRYDLIAEKLSQTGGHVFRKIEGVPSEKALFFVPMGMGEEGILQLIELALPDSVFLVAKATSKIKAAAEKRNVSCIALFDAESYRKENSTATAEGTLAEIIQKTDRNLSDQCVLVYGYGNCGKAIADLLYLVGCEVWVWSRERGQKKALADGFNLFPAPTHGLSMFDCVINTVPEPIFSDSLLCTLREGSHFFQIASGLSGICPEDLLSRGVFFHPLPGLPGKISPAAEADLIFEIIHTIFKEKKERRK
jgi:dipicolinate synthase subunit A